MKQIEVTDRLAHYIKVQKEDKDHQNTTDSILLEAMVALHYARGLMDDGYREVLESAETAVTDLYFIIKQLRMKEDEK